MSPTKDQSLTKIIAVNNRSYELKLNLDHTNSVLKFDVTDKT